MLERLGKDIIEELGLRGGAEAVLHSRLIGLELRAVAGEAEFDLGGREHRRVRRTMTLMAGVAPTLDQARIEMRLDAWYRRIRCPQKEDRQGRQCETAYSGT